MGIPVLILGSSGSGKTTSLRNFKDIALVNVLNKPLPFRGGAMLKSVVTDDMDRIAKIIKDCKSRSILVDDAGYCLSNYYKINAYSKSWDVYKDLAIKFSSMVEAATNAPNDRIVYFTMHTEELPSGTIQPLTVGKLLSEKFNLCGMFTICLLAKYLDGKYIFQTQTTGHDPCKSPMEMFSNRLIDNDLKIVDNTIRAYYGILNKQEDTDDAVQHK